MMLTGSKILMNVLREEKVKTIFGYPGAAVIDIYDEIARTEIQHVMVRHEQGAVHAADGYARASGQVGGMFGDLGARCHEHSDRHRLSACRFHPHGDFNWPGADTSCRGRCIPGSGHCWHHSVLHQTQLYGAVHCGLRSNSKRSFLFGPLRPTWPCANRHPEGHRPGTNQLCTTPRMPE